MGKYSTMNETWLHCVQSFRVLYSVWNASKRGRFVEAVVDLVNPVRWRRAMVHTGSYSNTDTTKKRGRLVRTPISYIHE